MCLNPKVLLGIGSIIVLVYVFVPQFASYAWILLLLACPISMMLMMSMNEGRDAPERMFMCPECGLSYKEAEWAKKCGAWCKEHHSCNLEITLHSVNTNDQ